MAAKENLKYKNSVFVDLFFEDESAEKNEISLYNALHEEPLPAVKNSILLQMIYVLNIV